MLFDPTALPTIALVGIFAAAAVAVWVAGTRLTHSVNAIAGRTGLGKAFTGMLLLGGITSLPELAAVSTSAAIGNAPLAVNNLLGSASVNLVLLAIADFLYGRGALTVVAAKPATLMQGVLSILLACFVAMVATVGDVPLLGVGAGSAALALGSAAAIWIASGFEKRHVWVVVDRENDRATERKPSSSGGKSEWPMRKLVFATLAAGAVIMIAGYVMSIIADTFADRTGISSGMVGFVLVAAATSLPEISSMTAAVRLREYDLAVGDIFGTNLFNFSLIFVADLVYGGGPVLSATGPFESIGAMLAALITSIFLVGLLERRSITLFRMGLDSIAALIAFALGIFALSQLAQ